MVRVIQIGYDEITQAATLCEREAHEVGTLVSTAQRCVGQLKAGGWVGGGANAFFKEMQELVFPGLERLRDALQQTGQTLKRTHRLMRTAEEEAARLFAYDPAEFTERVGLVEMRSFGDTDKRGKIVDTRVRLKPVGKHKLYIPGKGDVGKDGKPADVHPNDAIQSKKLGDCFLVSSLGAIAYTHPEVIKKMIKDNGDGTYTVTLHEIDLDAKPTGKVHEITVTPEFPTKGRHIKFGDREGLFVEEIWPQIIEKAYAQLKGNGDVFAGYKEIIGGFGYFTLAQLTGQPSLGYSRGNPIKFEDLLDMAKRGDALILESLWKGTERYELYKSSTMYADGTLFPNHAYWIKSIDPVTKKIEFINPYDKDQKPISIHFDVMFNYFITLSVNPIVPQTTP